MREWRPSSLGTGGLLIICQCFMAIAAASGIVSCIADWIAGCSAYQLRGGLCCAVIGSASLLAEALSVL